MSKIGFNSFMCLPEGCAIFFFNFSFKVFLIVQSDTKLNEFFSSVVWFLFIPMLMNVFLRLDSFF